MIGLYDQYAEMRFNINRNLILPINKKQKKYRINMQNLREETKSLLVVVPSYYAKEWNPAQGNFYFEIFESAKEK